MRKGYRKKRPARKKQYKRKPVNKGNLRKRNLQPFVETKSVESAAESLYMDVTNATTVKPQATTILIPTSWKTLQRGLTDSTFVGRDVYDRYCNMKVLIDFSALPVVVDGTNLPIENIRYVQFWAKNTLSKSTTPALYDPSEFVTIAGKAMLDDNFGSHFLKYQDKSAKHIKIIKQGYLRARNTNTNFNPSFTDSEGTGTQGTRRVPAIKMSFNWKIQRKNRMHEVANSSNFVRADSWVPGVCFYSSSLHGQNASHVPHITMVSKTWFSDS